jgi:hypothetical protein
MEGLARHRGLQEIVERIAQLNVVLMKEGDYANRQIGTTRV